MATVFEQLKKIIVEELGLEENEVTLDASFAEDLNADSLDLIELITAVEEKFSTPERKLEIPDEDAENLKTVQDAVDYLHDHGIKDG
jgi:acyl carrier protein